MRDYRPPFLTEADDVPIGLGLLDGLEIATCNSGLSNASYRGSLFGKDRIGHTTPDAEVFVKSIDGIRANEFVLPTGGQAMSRMSKKMSSNTVSTGRLASGSQISNSYNAANVR